VKPVITLPALIGWGESGNVTSAGWQVTLCDLMACEAIVPVVVRLVANCYRPTWLLYLTLRTCISSVFAT